MTSWPRRLAPGPGSTDIVDPRRRRRASPTRRPAHYRGRFELDRLTSIEGRLGLRPAAVVALATVLRVILRSRRGRPNPGSRRARILEGGTASAASLGGGPSSSSSAVRLTTSSVASAGLLTARAGKPIVRTYRAERNRRRWWCSTTRSGSWRSRVAEVPPGRARHGRCADADHAVSRGWATAAAVAFDRRVRTVVPTVALRSS